LVIVNKFDKKIGIFYNFFTPRNRGQKDILTVISSAPLRLCASAPRSVSEAEPPRLCFLCVSVVKKPSY